MTATTTTATKRKPIRGFLYGVVLGLGLMMIVVGQGIAALGTWPPFLVLLAGIVIGTLWSTYGPAKAPKGPPPIASEVIDEPAAEAADEVTEAVDEVAEAADEVTGPEEDTTEGS
ncbi:MAG: hypothetical protein AAGA90_11670 [Actinomycetota bacterium]